jgi:hypothetical protein
MKHRSRIQGHADLIRPANSGGVVNTNKDEWLKAKRRLEQAEKQRQLESRITKIESSVQQILELLLKKAE